MVYLWQSSWCLTLNSKLLPTFLVFVSVDLFPISYNDISQHEHEAPSPTDSLHGLHAHIGVGLGSSIVIKRRHRQVVTPKFGSRFKSGGERPSIVFIYSLHRQFISCLDLVRLSSGWWRCSKPSPLRLLLMPDLCLLSECDKWVLYESRIYIYIYWRVLRVCQVHWSRRGRFAIDSNGMA